MFSQSTGVLINSVIKLIKNPCSRTNETRFLFHKIYKVSRYNAVFRGNQPLSKATKRNLQRCKDENLARALTRDLGHSSSSSFFFVLEQGLELEHPVSQQSALTWVHRLLAGFISAGLGYNTAHARGRAEVSPHQLRLQSDHLFLFTLRTPGDDKLQCGHLYYRWWHLVTSSQLNLFFFLANKCLITYTTGQASVQKRLM